MLQAPQARPAQAAPRRDRTVRHDPGQPVVRVVEPGRARRGEPEPEQPAPAQHLADPELARARGLALPLVARAPVQHALRPWVRAARLLPLPGHARVRVGGAAHDPPRARGAVGGVPEPVRGRRGPPPGVRGLGALALEGAPEEDGRALPGARSRAHGRGRARAEPTVVQGRTAAGAAPRGARDDAPDGGGRRRAARGLRGPRGHGLPRLGRDEPLARAGAGGPARVRAALPRERRARGPPAQPARVRALLARAREGRAVRERRQTARSSSRGTRPRRSSSSRTALRGPPATGS